MGTYAQAASTTWKNSDYPIGKLAALAEIVNLPNEFVSRNPYLVVNKVEWIQCRYLIVQRATSYTGSDVASTADTPPSAPTSALRTIPLDPAFRLTLNTEKLQIPDVLHKLEQLEEKLEDGKEEFNDSDVELMREPTVVLESEAATKGSKLKRGTSSVLDSPSKSKQKKVEAFVPCDDERLSLVKLLPPPKAPSRSAAIALQREMKQMIEQQKKEGAIEAGFYFDPVSCTLYSSPSLS
jgi:ubiquitin-conjugating enzyme E2 Q